LDNKLLFIILTKNGGVEQVVYDLAVGLQKMGIGVTLLACKGSSSPDEIVETIPPNSEVLYESAFKRFGLELKTEKKHYNKYRKHLQNLDIIHDHSQGKMSYNGFKKFNGRILGTFHNEIYPTIVKARNMVSISKRMTRWLNQHINERKEIPVVYNGINLSQFEYSDEKNSRFLFFSEIGVFKGAKVVYEIAKETGLPIDFAGKNGDMSDQIRFDSAPNIKFYGEVPEWKKRELFKNAKALIFPTGGFKTDWEEPFGLVMIEAMASGTPVIASNNGAVPEVINDGDTGFICSSKKEMIEKLEIIDEINPVKCRKWVEDRFSLEAMVKSYLTCYKRLLRGDSW